MALTSYTTLQVAIADWLNRDDLTSQIPDFIRLAEEDVEVEYGLGEDKFDTLTLSDSPTNLPSDCREVKSLFFSDIAVGGDIEIVPVETLAYRQASLTQIGRPRYGAIVENGTKLLLAPTPDVSYVAGIQYVKVLARLSSTQSTNWLLTNYPKVYLYGALCHAAPFLKDDGRLPLWQAERDRAVATAKSVIERRRYGNTPVVRPRIVLGG